jgi:hypothetical protein
MLIHHRQKPTEMMFRGASNMYLARAQVAACNYGGYV